MAVFAVAVGGGGEAGIGGGPVGGATAGVGGDCVGSIPFVCGWEATAGAEGTARATGAAGATVPTCCGVTAGGGGLLPDTLCSAIRLRGSPTGGDALIALIPEKYPRAIRIYNNLIANTK